MIPPLLDFLTIFFIVAGCFLLWFNLQRRRDVYIVTSPDEQPAQEVPEPSSSQRDDNKPTHAQVDDLDSRVQEVVRAFKNQR